MDEFEKSVLSVRLFGSVARGEADDFSDLDILVIVDRGRIDEVSLRRKIGIPDIADISIYSSTRIKEMFSSGHLFALHLYLESKPYLPTKEETWFDALGAPANYDSAQQDMLQFLDILEESLSAAFGGSDYVFEAGICHLAARNIGMICSYLETGMPDFSRYSAMRLEGLNRPDIDINEYDVLLNCRRLSKRGSMTSVPSADNVYGVMQKIKSWASQIRRKYYVKS